MNFFFGIGKRSLNTADFLSRFYRSCLQSRNQLVKSLRKGLILIAESEEERQQSGAFEASKTIWAPRFADVNTSNT